MVDYRRANEPHLSSGLAKTMPLDKYLERDTVVDNRRANEPHLSSGIVKTMPLDKYLRQMAFVVGSLLEHLRWRPRNF